MKNSTLKAYFEILRLCIIKTNDTHPVSNIIANDRYDAACISSAVNVNELYMAKTSAISAGITCNSLSLIIIRLIMLLLIRNYFAMPKISLRTNHNVMPIIASMHIPITKSIRFGPAGFVATVELLSTVNAGVFS